MQANFSTTRDKRAEFYKNAADAIKDIPNGAKLLVGGMTSLIGKF